MAEGLAGVSPPLVTDAFLGGRLLLRQPAEGHRYGTDAVLLAAAAPSDFSGLAIDAGAGVGAAGLALAIARPGLRIGFLETTLFSLDWRGKKGSRAPIAIAPPLVLHDGKGFTPAAEAIHRGLTPGFLQNSVRLS